MSPPKTVWTGLDWSPDQELHLVGRRAALALVEFGNASIPLAPQLRLTNNETGAASPIVIPLNRSVPHTAGDLDDTTLNDGGPYSATAYSAIIPAQFVTQGLTITIPLADGGSDKAYELPVGCPTPFKMISIPFYFYGASEHTLHLDGDEHFGEPLTAEFTGTMHQARVDEYFTRLPVANFTFELHTGRKFEHKDVIVKPKGGRAPAGRFSSKAALDAVEAYDGYTVMGTVLNLLGLIARLDGEWDLATQYYAPLIMVSEHGWYEHPWGGLGGGHIGTGPHYDEGGGDSIMHHEMGHAFGLPHVGDWYPDKYPYQSGGLAGSGWGYNEFSNQMIDIFQHGTMDDTDNKCRSYSPIDEHGRCYKGDPMQGNSGNDNEQHFGIMSDFNLGFIQRYFEGTTTSNGRLFFDEATGVYSRWDPIERIFVPQPRDDSHLAKRVASRGVPVVKIIAAVSCFELRCYRNGGEAPGLLDNSALSVTTVYQVIEHVGNAVAGIDADDPIALANVSRYAEAPDRKWSSSGADFLFKVTFKDESIKRIVIPSSFRNDPTGTVKPSSAHAMDTASFQWMSAALESDGKAVAVRRGVKTPTRGTSHPQPSPLPQHE